MFWAQVIATVIAGTVQLGVQVGHYDSSEATDFNKTLLVLDVQQHSWHVY
jgi:hypothetical protein